MQMPLKNQDDIIVLQDFKNINVIDHDPVLSCNECCPLCGSVKCGKKGNVCRENDRCALIDSRQILLEPFQFFGPYQAVIV